MIDWYLENDDTEPVIQARVHARSEHRGEPLDLPETAVLFFQSQGVPYLQAHHPVVTLTEMLPRFLFPTPVYAVKGEEGVCFLDGGRGAPQGADTVETLFALGVKKFILVGYCGCFAGEVGLCDAVAPPRILVEEGTSHHYHPRIRWAAPSPELHRQAVAFLSPRLRVWEQPTVTTDAVYRQTVRKEALWRQQGCVGGGHGGIRRPERQPVPGGRGGGPVAGLGQTPHRRGPHPVELGRPPPGRGAGPLLSGGHRLRLFAGAVVACPRAI